MSESPAEQQAFARYIALHKQLRPLLHSGNTIRLDHPDKTTLINAVIAHDQQQAVVLISQLALPEYALCGNVLIPGLNPSTHYQIEVLDMPDSMHKPRNNTMKRYPSWLKSPLVVSGDWLEKAGIALPILNPESAILIQFSAVN